MKIVKPEEVSRVLKPEGTDVRYYLFSDYEIHYNDQAPHTTQSWHHHERIWETLFIIEGELIAKWRENGQEKSEIVKAGYVIETERSPHTFANETDSMVRFLVVKRIPADEDYSETFKSDKVLD
jgi:uncharacterized cupin superfamily protein